MRHTLDVLMYEGCGRWDGSLSGVECYLARWRLTDSRGTIYRGKGSCQTEMKEDHKGR